MQPPSTGLWHFGIHSSPVTSSQESLVSCDPCHYWGFVQSPEPQAHTLILFLSATALCRALPCLEGSGAGAGGGHAISLPAHLDTPWPCCSTVSQGLQRKTEMEIEVENATGEHLSLLQCARQTQNLFHKRLFYLAWSERIAQLLSLAFLHFSLPFIKSSEKAVCCFLTEQLELCSNPE